MLLLLLLGVVIMGVFVAVEARVPSPMVPLRLFRSRTFSSTNVLTLFLYAGLGGSFFFIPFALIQVHEYTPAQSGAAPVAHDSPDRVDESLGGEPRGSLRPAPLSSSEGQASPRGVRAAGRPRDHRLLLDDLFPGAGRPRRRDVVHGRPL